ncbi:HAMP domain-containing protein [Pseudothauera nasutitermitis]|uniref:HAMP domain-containing protein n=1 Tax=Pseudothauera nasutitermitis TaxID=2565930 RepID=A0A4V6RX85_9RHOO|nr:biofilm regulation protein phosphatase SiaA [Pseudothauera nasutitermitis]THF65535.1 HAMP domain-containing protein [Pseudothauera nasutitermitis]
MADWGHGIRAKSTIALLLACLVALVPAVFIGLQMVERIRDHFGEAYARNFTELHGERILGPLARELALTRRLANSVAMREWLHDEDNEVLHARAFREAESFRQDFLGRSYSFVSSHGLAYYYNDDATPYSEAPRYLLDPDKPDDAWFFSTMRAEATQNLNPNPDRWLQKIMVWINVVIEDGGERLGVASTGVDLSTFIQSFVRTSETGVTPMIIDAAGAIQAHPDSARIALGSGATGAAAEAATLNSLLSSPEERSALADAMQRATATPGQVQVFEAVLDGRRQLLALTYLDALRWYMVTAVDLNTAQIIEGGWLKAALGALVAVAVLLLGAFTFAVDRLLLRPLHGLHQSATALAEGHYDVTLPPPGRDELGDLNRAFERMAKQIKTHTEELEEKVRTRTQALSETNAAMAEAQKKIGDSIQYASLIQRALLPDNQLTGQLGEHHFVLWRPRDVVGGDFYLFRADGEQYLAGVVDCAGHGVPGALMTMLARAALDDAMSRHGLDAPAAVLTQADTTLRGMLDQSALPRAIATNMDAGLVSVDRTKGRLRFAGAKISLYWSDGKEIGELPGARRALCDRRVGSYHQEEMSLVPEATYYLVTDGFLDQAGGELGFGFGNSRLKNLLLEHARLPMDEQAAALDDALERYRGAHPQRDDITILSFRIH